MKKLLASSLLLASLGCATRGTIAELGRPEFAPVLPAGVELTLVEPRVEGEFHAYPKGAGLGDYHCRFQMEEAVHREGDNLCFTMDAIPTGDRRIKLFAMIVWPLHSKDEETFRKTGRPPGNVLPLRSVSVSSPVLDHEYFGLMAGFPAEKVKGYDELGLSKLVQFEDGWVAIADVVIPLPPQ